MIYGIGSDIIEINRFINPGNNFLNKVYTHNELMLLRKSAQSLAGNFAAKEAVAKALGTGFSGFGAKDIEILRNPSGAPVVTLYGGALKLYKDNKCSNIHVSISHNKEQAIAFAVIEGGG